MTRSRHLGRTGCRHPTGKNRITGAEWPAWNSGPRNPWGWAVTRGTLPATPGDRSPGRRNAGTPQTSACEVWSLGVRRSWPQCQQCPPPDPGRGDPEASPWPSAPSRVRGRGRPAGLRSGAPPFSGGATFSHPPPPPPRHILDSRRHPHPPLSWEGASGPRRRSESSLAPSSGSLQSSGTILEPMSEKIKVLASLALLKFLF